MLFRCSSIGLWHVGSQSPHAALVGLDLVIATSIEANGLVVHVQPPAPQFPAAFLVGQPGRGVPFVVFDPHPASCVVSQSKCVIQVPGHVLNVAVQAHAGIQKHGNGRPGAVREAAAEKAVDGGAGLPQACGIGHPDHAAVPEQAQRCVSFVRCWAHSPGAPPVLPARRPQVQQSHQTGFGGLLSGVPARRFHVFSLTHHMFQCRAQCWSRLH